MPDTPMVAVFDTAFHQTMPEMSYLYGIPYEYYEKYKVRRYGFHGTSHSYVSMRAAGYLNRNYEDMKIVVCHLGNGSSISAVQNGKSVDTSMGFTPLEGLLMGTRSGDIDPGAMQFLMMKEDLTIAEMLDVLNRKSGVLGVSGVSSDFRDIMKAAEEGNHRAQTALDSFTYRVVKYIGAYAAAMGGIDAIVFTAGVGENDGSMRKKICNQLSFLGIALNEEANSKRGSEQLISTADSNVAVLVIPTNEELAIARETISIVQ
jgi:acetate kinase